MRTPDYFTTEVVRHIKDTLPEMADAVFKKEKPPRSEVLPFIVVNSLPVTFGKALNDDTIINVNVHVGKTNADTSDTVLMNGILSSLLPVLGLDDGTEDSKPVRIADDFDIVIDSVYPETEDMASRTYYTNIRLKVIYTTLN